jgi:sec-independent protein translocase protein TatB
MFDIGFTELLLVAIVALLVLGPERLPQAMRTLGLWIGRMRRSFNAVRDEIEREVGMDDIRRQLHNEAVMEELRRIEQSVKSTATATTGLTARTAPPQDAPSDAAPGPVAPTVAPLADAAPGADVPAPPAVRDPAPTVAAAGNRSHAPEPGH